MPEVVAPQAELPLPAARPNKFIIPDDPVVNAPDGKPAAPAVAESVQKDAQNTEEQAPSTAPEGEKPEEVTPEQAAKREGRRFERRLGAAYRKAAEAQARADLLEQELAKFKTPAQAAATSGEPTLEQYGFDAEKYAEAKADYAKQQVAKEFQTRQQTQAQQQVQAKLIASWEEKVDKVAEKYEDFDTVVGELKPVSPLVMAIMEADNAPDLAYHLGKNPREAERISKLPVLSQIREIGKLEAKLAAEPVKPKTPSKAPAPITPLTGTAPLSTEESLNDPNLPDAQLDKWMKARNKKLAARR